MLKAFPFCFFRKITQKITQKISQKLVLNLLKDLQEGAISLQDQSKNIKAGKSDYHGPLKAAVQVLRPRAYGRITQRGSIGAAEGFMLGEWTTEDLVTLLRIFIRNRTQLFKLDSGWAKLYQAFWRYFDRFKKNTPEQSRLNISAHYDLGNQFFKLFLDSSLMYSSALFSSPTDDLDIASEKKLKRICEKLNLEAHHHLIEIGTGWGGFAIYAAKNYGCHVTTTTISEEQYQFVKNKIHELNLSQKITLLKQDYRSLTGHYDRLVSIEMIEAVGYEFMGSFVKQCDKLVKNDGMGLIQAIIRPDQKYHQVYKEVDFIKKYIFPGGCLLSTLFLLEEFAKHSSLRLFDLKDMGYDYAQTLSIWRERFMNKRSDIRNLGFNEEFIRMWEFYLAYCEAGFLERYISVAQFVFVKPAYAIN